ncbi:MAG: DUF3237 domain-containing protein [Sphaerospermopsis kisseleviana]
MSLPADLQDKQNIDAGSPLLVEISLTPYHPGYVVSLEYRLNHGAILSVPALPALIQSGDSIRIFHAVLPPQKTGILELLPVLFHQGHPLSPTLQMAPPCTTTMWVQESSAAPQAAFESGLSTSADRLLAMPQWNRHLDYLATAKVTLRQEVIGETPDGFRINWHIVDGHLVGPDLEAFVCPGGADWMRIREDGIGVVDVNVSFRTAYGAMVYANYGGFIDLGLNGYKRAVLGEFDPSPPVIVTPTYITADEKLAWLNRLQCLGVGRVNFQALEVCFDVYKIEVGAPIRPSSG